MQIHTSSNTTTGTILKRLAVAVYYISTELSCQDEQDRNIKDTYVNVCSQVGFLLNC